MKKFKEIINERNVSELTLSNEGHAFYSTFLEGDVLKFEKRLVAAVKALKKNLPDGTWSAENDGKKIA